MIRKKRAPWVMRLPRGLRDQPGWIFIGMLTFLAGLSYVTGVAESTSITKVLDPTWLRIWGGVLCVSGGLVVFATWSANIALERLALRILSLSLVIYMSWICLAVPFNRATFTIMMGACLVGLSEIRVGVLTAVLRPLPVLPPLHEED